MGRNAGREWLASGGVRLGEGRSAGAGGRLALAFHAIEAVVRAAHDIPAPVNHAPAQRANLAY